MIKLFICTECYKTFESPTRWEERHGLDTPPYEHFSGCPYCSGAYTEAFQCDCCGDWIGDSYIKTDNGLRYCDNCFRQMEFGDE